ncbi:MAG: hypothetical protein ACE5QF_00900 [Thermoplasmata archaeon]
MLTIVRVRVWLKERNERGVAAYRPGNLKKLWEHVLANHKDWDGSNCQIVYMTHRHMREDISLFVYGEDMNDISEFALAHLAPLTYVRSLRFISLMNPRFFPIPKDTFQRLERYTLAISCEPRHLTSVYDTLSRYKGTESVVPNYLAYTLSGGEGDLLASYSTKGESTMRKFVDRYIRPLDGVTDVSTTRISRTKRLVSAAEWKVHFEIFVPEEGLDVEEIEAYEDDWISGC